MTISLYAALECESQTRYELSKVHNPNYWGCLLTNYFDPPEVTLSKAFFWNGIRIFLVSKYVPVQRIILRSMIPFNLLFPCQIGGQSINNKWPLLSRTSRNASFERFFYSPTWTFTFSGFHTCRIDFTEVVFSKIHNTFNPLRGLFFSSCRNESSPAHF